MDKFWIKADRCLHLASGAVLSLALLAAPTSLAADSASEVATEAGTAEATTPAEESTSDSTTLPLSPYVLEYKTSARGFTLSTQRELKQLDSGQWELTEGGDIMVLGLEHKAFFNTEGLKVIPTEYIYRGKGLMKRRAEVHFDHKHEIVRSLYKDEWYDLPYTPDTLDRMSQQEQARLLLLNEGPTEEGAFTVADRKRVKTYNIELVGEEQLDTELGKVKTLHFSRIHDDEERTTDFWVAPEWDYIIVRTVHVDDGSPAETNLVGGTLKGEPLKP